MTKYRRLISPFAAAVCIAAVTWTATPAAAVEDNAVTGQAAKSAPAKSADAKTAPSVIKRHAWRRSDFAASRYSRRVSLEGTGPLCSGVWCGRQFVLMIGIGF